MDAMEHPEKGGIRRLYDPRLRLCGQVYRPDPRAADGRHFPYVPCTHVMSGPRSLAGNLWFGGWPGVRFGLCRDVTCAVNIATTRKPGTHGRAREWDAKALFDRAWRYPALLGQNGGLTVSGGEPFGAALFVTEAVPSGKGARRPHHIGHLRPAVPL